MPANRKTNSKKTVKINPGNAQKKQAKKAKIKTKLVAKKTAKEMANELLALYPEAECELIFANNYQLLTAVILSAQTTDTQVNKVTRNLFKKYPETKDLSEAPLEDIKEIIKATGYYNSKAKNIKNCAIALMCEHKGIVPDNFDELIKLPGVGRKTANVVLGVAFGESGWTVDTHVQRISKRLGLTKNVDPYKIELDLQSLFPEYDWSKLSITMIWHGRRMCYARNPDCYKCPINNLCPSSEAVQ